MQSELKEELDVEEKSTLKGENEFFDEDYVLRIFDLLNEPEKTLTELQVPRFHRNPSKWEIWQEVVTDVVVELWIDGHIDRNRPMYQDSLFHALSLFIKEMLFYKNNKKDDLYAESRRKWLRACNYLDYKVRKYKWLATSMKDI